MTVFSKPGKENTEAAVKIALDAARGRGIRHIVVASYTGYTADFFKKDTDLNVVVVRGTYGYNVKEPGNIRMPADKYSELCAAGMTVVTAAHALSGAERALSTVFKGAYPVELIAHTLRMLGQGTKVCVECAAMACDCGAIPPGEPVVAVAGTAEGADTVLILRPANTHRLLETKIDEILCKPIS
jgi:hypothetical protein